MKNDNSNLFINVWKDNLKKFDFIHGHMGFECDSCGHIPEIIYNVWISDQVKQRLYMRMLCRLHLDRLTNEPGSYINYVDLLRVESLSTFADINSRKDIIFIGKNFYLKANGEKETSNRAFPSQT